MVLTAVSIITLHFHWVFVWIYGRFTQWVQILHYISTGFWFNESSNENPARHFMRWHCVQRKREEVSYKLRHKGFIPQHTCTDVCSSSLIRHLIQLCQELTFGYTSVQWNLNLS